ncbi:c-type cytochrome [Actimicrobium sp. CCI2.3]|uniref:c-type cytochrome n=1 Tax=Actimicrobium sp. CCI2.3 TaxID=3048616 RepID=UPI002AB4A132|nr:c-type cytochrome [Actimicrobium sp. CCI2.3]MDY7575678.1 c-type cytochrome [Actimicrobium sp. CCI2.3]MEB0021951.1 c-type cytochrome [Actimicrobium sp. CCI2.3]
MKKFLAGAVFALCSAAAMNASAAGNADNGKALTAKYNCAACHGADFNSPIDPTYPKLAGQHADYLKHALVAYKRGGDALNGRNNAIMAGMAKPLSAVDIEDIAAYLHGLPGSLVMVKQ